MSSFENSNWRTTAILKIVLSPYFSEMSSDFDEILYFVADWVYNETNVTETQNFKFRYAAMLENIILAITPQRFVRAICAKFCTKTQTPSTMAVECQKFWNFDNLRWRTDYSTATLRTGAYRLDDQGDTLVRYVSDALADLRPMRAYTTFIRSDRRRRLPTNYRTSRRAGV